ncbi:MAG: outer membrane protein [Bdellovibrionales bacterium]
MKTSSALKVLFGLGLGLVTTPAMAELPPPVDWSGGYVGGFLGGSWTDFDGNAGSGTDEDIIFGGDVGMNWQNGRLVWGLEGDFAKIDQETSGGGVRVAEDWMTTIRGRAGFAVDRFLPYVTAGIGLTDVVSKVGGSSDDRLQPGFAVGGGVDYMMADHWFGRVEYLHVDVPRDNTSVNGTTVAGGSSNDMVRVGINYKL